MSHHSDCKSLTSLLAIASDEWKAGLLLLWEASQQAKARGKHEWSYAVGMHELRAAGLHDLTTRILVEEGVLVGLKETTGADKPDRCFQRVRGPTFFDRSCFVLSPLGEKLVRRLWASHAASSNQPITRVEAELLVPHWNVRQRRLTVGPCLVYPFTRTAPVQEWFLDVLQQEKWKNPQENPFLQEDENDAEKKLRNVVHNLNKKLHGKGLRFHVDDGAKTIRWVMIVEELELTTLSNP